MSVRSNNSNQPQMFSEEVKLFYPKLVEPPKEEILS